MRSSRFPRWLAVAVIAEGALGCLSLALILRQLADLVQGDQIFRFSTTGAAAEVLVSAGIPALLLIALALCRPLPPAWWRAGSWPVRIKGIGAVVLGSWLLLNMAAGALQGPSNHISGWAVLTAALGTATGVVAVVGLVWLGRSRLKVEV